MKLVCLFEKKTNSKRFQDGDFKNRKIKIISMLRQMESIGVRLIIIIYKMQNTQNHQVSKCQMHSFSLRALQKERRPNLTANASMCRGKQGKSKKIKTQCANFEGAIFNKDRCHATPAFILPSQKVEYLSSLRELIREHEKRVKQSEEDNQDMYYPKPKSKSMYCNVCRTNYLEYLDHITSQQHRINIRNSDFNRHILDLTKQFRNKQPQELPMVLTETGSGLAEDDQVQIIGSTGRKMIKVDQQQPERDNVPFVSQPLPNYTIPISFNTFGFPQLQSCNPFEMMSRSYMQPMGYPAFSPFYQQQGMMNYPWFCLQGQPSIMMNIFQPQG